MTDEYGERIYINSFYGYDYIVSKYDGMFSTNNSSKDDFISLLIERDELSFDVVACNDELISFLLTVQIL